jgi:hypothetical protein
MYGDFHAKNTVFTPYIPINVWFWPTLSMCGRRSCCWLCCCTWATRTLHTLPLAVGCATHGPIAPYTPYFLLLAVLHMGPSHLTHLTLAVGCAAHGPLVPYTPYLLLLAVLYLTSCCWLCCCTWATCTLHTLPLVGPLVPYTCCWLCCTWATCTLHTLSPSHNFVHVRVPFTECTDCPCVA